MSPRGARRTGRGPDYATTAKFLAFVAVTGLLTFFIGQQILGASFNDRYRLTAEFDDVTGLLTGDQVKIAGTPVGQVKDIKVVRGRAVVRMAVDKDARVPDDSTAAIRWRNVLGQRVVYLEPGQSRTMLHAGARVPHTRSAVDLGEIVNAVQPLVNNLDPNQINRILFALSEALDGNETAINTMITNLDGLLRTFGSRKATIQQMIKDYSAVTDAVAVRDRQIAQSIDNLRDLARVFAANRTVLENAVVQVSGVTTNLNAVLGGNDAQLARIIDNLGRFSGTFRINVDQLEKMVRTLPVPLRQLFATTNGGHFLRTDVMCLNLVEGPCPFPMRLPHQPGNPGPTKQDLATLKSILNGGR
ncbi:MCE family protein [Actinomadura logoneensis]|uniref:MCE family protein n=1 Tax=Actinomadura logoneensis TaxID=2293572 RepID=A0A372JJG7_9ACTN|nr:MlaD family protein [Actinomadura logoneensis]RFU39994.1 MCE family protein [Actinomadura logoneensis]